MLPKNRQSQGLPKHAECPATLHRLPHYSGHLDHHHWHHQNLVLMPPVPPELSTLLVPLLGNQHHEHYQDHHEHHRRRHQRQQRQQPKKLLTGIVFTIIICVMNFVKNTWQNHAMIRSTSVLGAATVLATRVQICVVCA